ncbi:hypothetical protein N0V82_002073 [Gnomoniopsis sp. IMI 355080]|nr:hypothetical protein N0V82_002073 [Gnomoniopsis sp. IMI 355080]
MAELETFILPLELIDSQLSMVELLMAMYPSNEDDADLEIRQILHTTRELCEASDWPKGAESLPSSLELTVTIPLEHEIDSNGSVPNLIQMNVLVPLRSEEKSPTESPPPVYAVRQPSWMSRAEVTELSTEMPMDDILAAFEYVKDNAIHYFKKDKAHGEDLQSLNNSTHDGPLLRVWFYFPSLSTREKRKDLVTYAPRYDLTGFVLAGKPGVLCLEGTSRNVDDYMNAIKNESWGDIPSHQKKVSERFRENCDEGGRKFVSMREITDDLGEKRGTRKNRGDMAALEAFLKEKGVGESFSKVIMGA